MSENALLPVWQVLRITINVQNKIIVFKIFSWLDALILFNKQGNKFRLGFLVKSYPSYDHLTVGWSGNIICFPSWMADCLIISKANTF